MEKKKELEKKFIWVKIVITKNSLGRLFISNHAKTKVHAPQNPKTNEMVVAP